MREIERIVDQLRRALDGPAWHGPALEEVLSGLSASEAAARPLRSTHTIWEIVLHLIAWHHATRRYLDRRPVALAPDEDWPPVPEATEAAWQQALDTLRTSHERLVEAVRRQPDEILEETVPDRDFSFYVLLHGVVQHDLYHAGQVILLRKAMTS